MSTYQKTQTLYPVGGCLNIRKMKMEKYKKKSKTSCERFFSVIWDRLCIHFFTNLEIRFTSNNHCNRRTKKLQNHSNRYKFSISKCWTQWHYIHVNSPTKWHSKLQHCIATSKAESEYYSVNDCKKHSLWYLNLLNELNIYLST